MLVAIHESIAVPFTSSISSIFHGWISRSLLVKNTKVYPDLIQPHGSPWNWIPAIEKLVYQSTPISCHEKKKRSLKVKSPFTATNIHPDPIDG
jgi:hypothetical protein